MQADIGHRICGQLQTRVQEIHLKEPACVTQVTSHSCFIRVLCIAMVDVSTCCLVQLLIKRLPTDITKDVSVTALHCQQYRSINQKAKGYDAAVWFGAIDGAQLHHTV